MEQDRHARISELFNGAIQLRDDERSAFLDRACGNDAALRDDVLKLLAHDVTDAMIDPAAGSSVAYITQALTGVDAVGTVGTLPNRIGNYEIKRIIGSGGMGTVYEATQEMPQRTVALKVMRAGMQSPDAVRRFEFESEILGRLSHPAIAQIYEAGLHRENGVAIPFYAMEFVPDALPLDEYARRNNLSVGDRLRLIARVCDAVHHGHLQGVIHRDLKPANVLVDAAGAPKVIDYGVARATSADSRITRVETNPGQLLGTIRYMAPEQVAADPAQIDARCDVYALGLICYELLTGVFPYELEGTTMVEALRRITQDRPRPLRAAAPNLEPDLELILAKVLEKERDQRYSSAGEFAQDLRNFLNKDAIIARRPTLAYRMRVFARRNRALVGGVAAVMLTLAAGLITSTVLYFKADDARRAALTAQADADDQREIAEDALAESEAARIAEADARAKAEKDEWRVRHVNKFFTEELLSAVDPNETPNREITMLEVLDAASEDLVDEYPDDPIIAGQIHGTLGRTYRHLGKHERAIKHQRAAYEISKEQLPPSHPQVHNTRTNLAISLGNTKEAEAMLRESLAGMIEHNSDDEKNIATTKHNLAQVLMNQGNFAESESLYKEALAFRRDFFGADQRETLVTMLSLATCYMRAAKYEEARDLFNETLAVQRESLGPADPDTITTMNNLSNAERMMGNFAVAAQMLVDATPLAAEALGKEHPEYLIIRGNLAGIYEDLGDLAAAEPIYRECLDTARRTLGPEHLQTIGILNNLAGVVAVNQPERAEPLYLEVIEARTAALGDDHPSTLIAIHNYAFFQMRRKEYDKAEPAFRDAMAKFDARMGPKHPNTFLARSNLSRLLLDTDRPQEALEHALQTLTDAEGVFPAKHPLIVLFHLRHGIARERLGEFELAEELITNAYDDFVEIYGTKHDKTQRAVRAAIGLYERWEKPDMADEWREKLAPPGEA